MFSGADEIMPIDYQWMDEAHTLVLVTLVGQVSV
jgi:hypothetical protein